MKTSQKSNLATECQPSIGRLLHCNNCINAAREERGNELPKARENQVHVIHINVLVHIM